MSKIHDETETNTLYQDGARHVGTKEMIATTAASDQNGKRKTIPVGRKVPSVDWERPTSESEELSSTHVFGEDDEILRSVAWPSSTDLLCHNCCHVFEGVPVPLPQTYDRVRKIYYCSGNFCSWQCSKTYNMTQTPLSGRGNRNMYIALLAYKTWVKYRGSHVDIVKGVRINRPLNGAMMTYATYCIHPFPPREVLRVFGGSTSIDEYRKGSFGIIPPNEALVETPFLTSRQRLLLPFLDASKKDPPDSSSKPFSGSGLDTTPLKMRSSTSTTQKIESSMAHKHSNAFCTKLNRAKWEDSVIKRKRVLTSKNTLMSTMGVVVEKKKRPINQ